VVRLEQNTLPVVVLGVLRLLFLHLLLRVSAAPIIGGMGLSSFRQQTVAACWGGRCIHFLRALLVQVTAPAPLAAGRLLAGCPDVVEMLAVVALRKLILSSTCLHPDCDVAEACSLPRRGRTTGSYGTA
jgi:hypothetical protein